ncbi:MAG: MBL fold metallo-hydrolase [Dehalococcoidia bacterium]
MKNPRRIEDDVYIIGGRGLSHVDDCSVYLINTGGLVLIDSGVGAGVDQLVSNIKKIGLSPENLEAILVSHAHIDHIGGLKQFKDEFGIKVIAHNLDVSRIENGVGIGAELYDITYTPCSVDIKIMQEEETLEFGDKRLNIIHIPGHTPGSIAAYLDTANGRILFGQDIHGPYTPELGSNIEDARKSLQKLIDLKADILCEGHFGVYRPAETVEKYIKGYLHSL